MYNPKKSSSKSSLIKSLAFLILLIASFLIISGLNRNGLPSQLSNFINADANVSRQKMSQMTEPQQDSLRKEFAGFWVSELNNKDGSVKKNNHLEVRDNGIIWQVINWYITFPSGDTLSTYLARTGYIMPYGKSSGKDGYACDVRIIRQIYINGNDTCYGASQTDELWLIQKNTEGLRCNDRHFQSFEGKLIDFFPQGMLDLVDKPFLSGCATGANLQTYAKDAIRNQLQNLAPMEFNNETMYQWIKYYYGPLIVDDILHSQMFFSIPDSLKLSFEISTEGKVLQPRIKSGVKCQVSNFIIQNLNTWSFPRHTLKEKIPTIDYSFHFAGEQFF